MYEAMTFDAILGRMLEKVSNDIDKRPGSVIYDALAPAAAELAQLYATLGVNYNLSFADTASGEELSRRTAEFGVNREKATKAQRKGIFYGASNALMDVPIGSRFSIGVVNFTAVSKISAGVYALECETAGIIGNQQFGTLLPIQFISGLSRAELGEVLIPGEDEEADDALRARYYEEVNAPAFGGNMADYKQKIGAMHGVGAVKVFPAWQGGGTVKCAIIASDWNAPSTALVSEVQKVVDPLPQSGQGIGTAPIGHKVTVAGVRDSQLDVKTTVTLAAGVTIGSVQEAISVAIEDYLLKLRKDWATQEGLIVRIALIEAAILTVPGVIDVTGTELNNSKMNVTLGLEEIPRLGTVDLHV